MIVNVGALFMQVLLLVMMLVPGVLIRKMNWGDGGFAKGISNLILYVAQLALIISPFIRAYDSSLLSGIIGVFFISFFAHILFYGIAVLLIPGASDKIKQVLRFSIVFSNAGYMGIPLIEAVLGSEAAIYATIYNISFNLFMWSLGRYIYTNDRKYVSPFKMFINPAAVAVYIGLVIFFLPIEKHIPHVIISAIDMLKGLVAPLSMILVGYHMAGASFKNLFKSGSLFYATFIRLIVCPVALFAILKLLSVIGIYHNEIAVTVSLLAASTPAATSTSMLAEKHDGDTETAGMLVPVSTVLAVITMPLVALLLNLY